MQNDKSKAQDKPKNDKSVREKKDVALGKVLERPQGAYQYHVRCSRLATHPPLATSSGKRKRTKANEVSQMFIYMSHQHQRAF